MRTVIAGYHWFTDWGRDTMISLEGLTITTGRTLEAGYILRTFAHYVRDGLIPNLFPDGKTEGLYHTADATLWFFHALGRYLSCHRRPGDAWKHCFLPFVTSSNITYGARSLIFTSIRKDGLLVQGKEGYQLTWMDAKMGDWVVTPRRGKAVEINALWYNALELLAGWLRETGDEETANRYREHAQRAHSSFNERFWYEEGGYLYDVLDGPEGDDNSIRPNQVFAISLDHPVLQERALGVGARGRGKRIANPGRAALAFARQSRIQEKLSRRSQDTRCGLSSGDGLGLVDRTIHRCLVESSS